MIRKIFAALLCAVLLMVPVCALAEGDDAAQAENFSVDFAVVFTADTNGQLRGDQEHIGYSKLTGLVEMQNEDAHILLLDAGNALGTEDPDKVVMCMSAVDYTATAVGTKDAALGKDRLRELDAKASFPLLCANWLRADGELYYDPYRIVEVDGLRIGILGLISPDIKEMYPEETAEDNVYDPVPIANIYYEEMREAGCEFFIALTSLGFAGDYTPLYLGANCPWIDMILDSNTGESNILDNGTIVEGTDTAVFNLASDFTSMSVIQVTAGHDGYLGLFPSTMGAADFSEITRVQRIEELVNKDTTPKFDEEGGMTRKNRLYISNRMKFVLLTLLIAGATVAGIVLVTRNKEKK